MCIRDSIYEGIQMANEFIYRAATVDMDETKREQMIGEACLLYTSCAFSLGLWACTGKDSDKFKNLSSDQFEEMIQDKTIQLVDVRTDVYKRQG